MGFWTLFFGIISKKGLWIASQCPVQNPDLRWSLYFPRIYLHNAFYALILLYTLAISFFFKMITCLLLLISPFKLKLPHCFCIIYLYCSRVLFSYPIVPTSYFYCSHVLFFSSYFYCSNALFSLQPAWFQSSHSFSVEFKTKHCRIFLIDLFICNIPVRLFSARLQCPAL